MINRQVLKYVIAGLTTFLCEYLSFVFVYKFFPNENIAHSISYAVAILVNFSLLRYFVFNKASTKFQQQALGYIVLIFVNFFLSNIIIYLLHNNNVNAYIAKALTMFIIIIWNYAIMNKLIFKSND